MNGCRLSQAEDARGRSEVEIGFGGVHGYDYVPACLRISAGARVRFEGPFEVHPLGVGVLADGAPSADPANPLEETAEGDERSFRLDRPGVYGFFCHYHAVEGMRGAIFVE